MARGAVERAHRPGVRVRQPRRDAQSVLARGRALELAGQPLDPYGGEGNDAAECRRRQLACLEPLDAALGPLLAAFSRASVLVCGDHGDAWGEDGLWSHGFFHHKVLEVPLLVRAAPLPPEQRIDPAEPLPMGRGYARTSKA